VRPRRSGGNEGDEERAQGVLTLPRDTFLEDLLIGLGAQVATSSRTRDARQQVSERMEATRAADKPDVP
jgi:hypothetical protein